MPEKVGRYKILGELGRGSMGTVYRAEDTLIGRVVALKTVSRPGPTSPPQEHEAYARFLREARAAGTFLHPNVVTVFDVGEDAVANLSYIAMEMVGGESLDHGLRRKHALNWDEIRKIGWQAASALRAAHDAGIVHRDIKPANLILTASGDVKVADFGIAKMANSAMTQDGSLLGSPGYMSPEQVRAASVDHRSDLYSLGIVLYELVTLKPAFPGTNVFEVITAVANSALKRPREIRPDVPADLEAIILRATSKERDSRFQSAADMMAALMPAAVPAGSVANVTLITPATRSEPTPAHEDVEPAQDATANIPDAASASAQFRAAAEKQARSAAVGAVSSAPKAQAKAGSSTSGSGAGRGVPIGVIAGVLILAVGGGLFALRGGDAPQIADPTLVQPSPEAAGSPAEVLPVVDPTPLATAATAETPATTPRRRTSVVPGAATSPKSVAIPTAAPRAAEPENFWRITVNHPHTTSRCNGTLAIDEQGIRYDSTDKDEDDTSWSWGDVTKIKVDGTLIEVGSKKKGMGGLLSKGARFRAEEGGVPAALEQFLRDRGGK